MCIRDSYLPGGARREGVVSRGAARSDGVDVEVFDGVECDAQGRVVGRGRWLDGAFEVHTAEPLDFSLGTSLDGLVGWFGGETSGDGQAQ